ncbi:MAG: hypothetical protein R2939_14590 [Kofleriaceae bacterium]
MKNVAMGTLLLATSSLVGCVVLDPGSISATVELQNAGPGALGACTPNDAIRINAIPRGSLGTPQSDLFNCDATTVTTALLDGGDYDIWLDYVHDNFTPSDVFDDLVVGTTGTLAATIDGDLALAATIVLDHGFFVADFNITDGGAPQTCAQVVDENGISLIATLSGTTAGEETLVDCEDGAIFSDPLPLGPYVVSMAILNSQDLSLGTSAPINASIDNGNEYEDLGTVEIPLD